MESIASTLILLVLAIHALLLTFVLVRGARSLTIRAGQSGRLWVSLMILFSAGAVGLLIAPDFVLVERLTRPLVTSLALTALLVVYGALVIRDTGARLLPVWLLIGLIWIVGIIAAAFLADPAAAVLDNIIALRPPQTILEYVVVVGFVLVAVLLIGITFYRFYAAKLPEIANRALFWVLNAAALLAGAVITLSGTESLSIVGVLLLTVSAIGAVYAHTSYRVFDIRRELASALRGALVLTLTASFIFAAIILARGGDFALNPDTFAALGITALAVAILYLPARAIFERILNSVFNTSLINAADATRRYSQQISGALELDSLAEISTSTLNNVMRVRRSMLILVNDKGSNDSVVEFQTTTPPSNMQELKNARRIFPKNGIIYNKLGIHQQPLSQFDLEFNPVYKTLPESERQFFRDLGMSAYAPIIAENRLIGVLAVGAKRNDAPYYPRDLELLATLANQTGAALRNARLVTDLRQLNRDMQSLNTGLEDAKEQMERLDAVKTDFVTIASHELRTPLAQIRGYTDILDALTEQDELDQYQAASMVGNLRKAAERMEELITAMLDVSQIDVNALDLRFAQTSMEAVVRMAIEPLSDAIRQRKLYLSSRGLRGLPVIQADLQRLVQAFRNLIVNAIKFTPDGGRIDISASLQPAQDRGDVDHILVKITDTGVGIAKENLELIFRKFYRAYDPSLHSTGTYKFMGAGPGLGLTIAQGVIEGHGGKVWAESAGYDPETFPGSTFYVLIPLTPPADARRVAPFLLSDAVAQESAAIRSQG